MTLGQLLEEGASRLSQKGIGETLLDARYLLLYVTGISPALFLIKKNEPADKETAERFFELIEQRGQRIPLQHILGTQEFMGLEFIVSPDVLIPRQDTETLTERVLADQKDEKLSGGDLLDMCTGSGCIGLSLAVMGNFQTVLAADISKKALAVAEKNAARLLPEHVRREKGLDVHLLESDLFQNIPSGRKFDVIVSNPPYIPSQVIKELEPEVRDHEPRLALDGTEDGLEFYRRLAAESGSFLNPGGRIYLEIGYDQGPAVRELLERAGFIETEIIKDIPGLDRVAAAKWPQEGTHV
ncbi:MAG: peptide chain release factor N(5)-glutamine methyltransferase [Lachnospiraceae bacterium]|jgi:release factor glutamine methyltransferase